MKPLLACIVPFALCAAAGPTLALDYSCRNAELEISCTNGRCSPSNGFTPMSAGVNTRRRVMSICAYSGCWDGRAAHVVVTPTHVVAHGPRLKPNSPQLGPAAAVLVIDRTTSGGSFTGFGFQNPMTCSLAP